MKIKFERTILEVGQPQRLVLRLADIEADTKGLSITIIRIGELRDDWVFGTVAPIKRGRSIECEITFDALPVGLYQVAEAVPETEGTHQIILSMPPTKRDDLYFVIDDGLFGNVDPKQLAIEIHARRADRAIKPLVTEEAKIGSPRRFEVIVFFAGVPLDHEQQLKGCIIKPVSVGVGLASLNEAVSNHLSESTGSAISFSPLADSDFRGSNRLFAVHIGNLWALGMQDALPFALEYAANIATLIGIERGEKPECCAVFFKDSEGFSIFPISKMYRGNLAPPMFKNDQAELIERYLPALHASPMAKLDLQLYSEAMAERDHGMQFFRHWSILEMIAARHVRSKTIQIRNVDGTIITTVKNQPRTTSGKSEMVYQYLFTSGLPAYSLGWKDNDGREVYMPGTNQAPQGANVKIVSLWNIVRAAYKIRNSVAHSGQFRPMLTSVDEEQLLANLMFTSGPFSLNFLAHATRQAVFRELDSVPI